MRYYMILFSFSLTIFMPQITCTHDFKSANMEEYCLKNSYPQVEEIRKESPDRWRIKLKNGVELEWDRARREYDSIQGSLDPDYPLEPLRPETDFIVPGRSRPYEFYNAIYGASPAEVQNQLAAVNFAGVRIRLAPEAARAFSQAAPKLESLLHERPDLAPLLKFDGSYKWREIAGEKRPSAHSYGIAIDFGADHAPYWRWSKKRPHPMQKTYPAEIVQIMEEHGFIWGGKWKEYDLMHFEYRPELICLARHKANTKQ